MRFVPPFVWAMLWYIGFCFALSVGPAFAFASDTIATPDNLGASLTWLQPYVIAAFSSLIMSGLAWLWYLVGKYLRINIEAKVQGSISAWCVQKAASLVASGFVRLIGMKVQVNSATLMRASQLAATEIPAALAHAGLSPETLSAMIVGHMPHVPTIAAVAASQAAAAGPLGTGAAQGASTAASGLPG